MAARPFLAPDPPLVAADVVRGTSRLLLRHDLVAMAEVPLPNGRRADLMAVCPRGDIVIVEIKVSRADLLGDAKWRDYLDYCDRYYWAVPAGFDLGPFDAGTLCDGACGLIVADRYDGAVVREPSRRPMAPARRKAEVLRFGRRAARRLLGIHDPDCEPV